MGLNFTVKTVSLVVAIMSFYKLRGAITSFVYKEADSWRWGVGARRRNKQPVAACCRKEWAVQVVMEEPQGRKEKLAVWLDVIKHDWMLGSHDRFPMFNHCTDLGRREKKLCLLLQHTSSHQQQQATTYCLLHLWYLYVFICLLVVHLKWVNICQISTKT